MEYIFNHLASYIIIKPREVLVINLLVRKDLLLRCVESILILNEESPFLSFRDVDLDSNESIILPSTIFPGS